MKILLRPRPAWPSLHFSTHFLPFWMNENDQIFLTEAVRLARENVLTGGGPFGAVITKNIVMLGALAATDILPFKSEILLETILDNVPVKFKEINKKAFESGMKVIKQL